VAQEQGNPPLQAVTVEFFLNVQLTAIDPATTGVGRPTDDNFLSPAGERQGLPADIALPKR
jgi:hypothetical protein